MRRFALCLLFVFGLCAVTSAQEQAPKAPIDGRVLQTLLDIDAKVERLSQLSAEDRIDRQHEVAQLREECAALKAKIDALERASPAGRDALLAVNAELRDVDSRLAATRIVRAGLFRRTSSVYVVTGAERQRLSQRRSALMQRRAELFLQVHGVEMPALTGKDRNAMRPFLIGYLQALGIGLMLSSGSHSASVSGVPFF